MKNKLGQLLRRSLSLESLPSILLILSLIAALLLANLSATQNIYFDTLGFKLGMSIHHWINDGLMAIFFYIIGLEIKKELVSGSLSSYRKAALPLFAAIGGMVIPALIYSFINTEAQAGRAWGIPMATDIAFALGALVLFGKRVPVELRALLLALAVIDDLGAILVIAFFYSSGVGPLWLLGFLSVSVVSWLIYKKQKWNWTAHIFLGLVAWYFMLSSGIHATLAGVIWGFLTPDDKSGHSPLDQAVHALHPYVNFLILPIFALANSGVKLPALSNMPSLLSSSLLWAIAIGLVVGKPVGIVISSWVCVRSGLGELPKGIGYKHILGIGLLAGIGFTMALFIAQLAIVDGGLLDMAKIGILLGSLISGVLGIAVLLKVSKTGNLKRG
jgi:Na+:H+ antiporter, NhaA family